jgi:AcrR family transcriptional regulator
MVHSVSMAEARDVLLAKIIDEAALRGLQDRSLRELADAVGTSHRMLLYHFGSREGLVDAVVAQVEAAERQVLRDLAADVDGPTALVRSLWGHVSSPEMRPFIRLFFESLAYTSHRSPDRHAEGLTAPWLEESEDVTAMVGAAFDPVEVRLGIAVVRGLLVDVLATGDAGPATESLERYLWMWERSTAPNATRPARSRRPAPR